MSYEASQKIHSALHWLAATQGVFIGGRTFLCWNPQGIEIPKPQAAFLRRGAAKQIKYSDYRKALSETLRGWQETIPRDAGRRSGRLCRRHIRTSFPHLLQRASGL